MNRLETVTLNWVKGKGCSHIGKVRTHNEDAYLLRPWPEGEGLLAVVADGIGGNHSGEIASKIAVETFAELLEEPLPTEAIAQYDLLLKQCYLADQRIREKAAQSFQTSGMGTTIIAAIITQKTCIHAYAGDSRLYHLRNSKIKYQTADHSIVQVLVELGRIKPEDIPTHPMRSVLNSCLGGKNADGNFSIDPKWPDQADKDPPIIDLQPHDYILLCSDGLTNLVSNEIIEQTINERRQEIAIETEKMVKYALENGGKDNITLILVQLTD